MQSRSDSRQAHGSGRNQAEVRLGGRYRNTLQAPGTIGPTIDMVRMVRLSTKARRGAVSERKKEDEYVGDIGTKANGLVENRRIVAVRCG